MNEENNIISVNEEVDVIEYDIDNIKNLIYTIRGKQVMIDSDVAMLYHYETKYINLVVRRNKERFPENFCFQLTKEEFDNLRLQIATLNYQTDDIIKSAKNKILIIDNYIDDSILKMLSKKNKNVEVVILTSQNSNISKLDINKFNKQYPSLKIAYTNKFHDRFIVIDNKELYHCGASLKDLGKKCFAINKMNDVNFIKNVEKGISLC